MATEYFIVKPGRKQIFSLGKHLNCFSGINCREKPEWIEYENFREFYMDVIDNNEDVLLDDHTIEDQRDFLWELFVWCSDHPVYLSNDCSDNYMVWGQWEETGSIYDFCAERIPVVPELRELIIENIPEEEWVYRKDRKIDVIRTLKPIIEGAKKSDSLQD